jgi:LysR family transcriptional activator of nhaA
VPLRLLSQINFNHLYYFWVVAREGSITRATTLLHLAQPTVSSQLRTLERTLGERLFERRGRGIALTETGTMVFRYADAMFGTARELAAALEGGPAEHPSRFAIGISDALPKLTATRLLTPAFASALPMYLECRSDKTERLLAALAIHEIDLVIADAPVPAGLGVRLFSHLIGESGVSIFAVPALAAKHRRRFPQSLDDAPMLLTRAGPSAHRRRSGGRSRAAGPRCTGARTLRGADGCRSRDSARVRRARRRPTARRARTILRDFRRAEIAASGGPQNA